MFGLFMGEILQLPVLPGDEGLPPSKCLAVGISRLLSGGASENAVAYLSRAIAKKKNIHVLVRLGWEMVEQGGHENELLAINLALHGVQGDPEVSAIRNYFRVVAWRRLKPTKEFVGSLYGTAAEMKIQHRIVGKNERFGLMDKIAEYYAQMMAEAGPCDLGELRVG